MYQLKIYLDKNKQQYQINQISTHFAHDLTPTLATSERMDQPTTTNHLGKIQGDGRNFLDHFKSCFGVTNIITIIKWDPYLPITAKIHNKRWVFSIYFCLWSSVRVSSSVLPFDVRPSFPVTMWTLPYADFGKTIVLMTERSQIAIFSIHFPQLLIAVACLMRPLT